MTSQIDAAKLAKSLRLRGFRPRIELTEYGYEVYFR